MRSPSIYILRNNDIGDFLVVTPLFEALKQRFPGAMVLAGIGDWNRPVLENNPFVDEVVATNAPWHNKQVCRHPQNSWRGRLAALHYLAFSPEVWKLRARRPDIGIDVLGSPHGALLFRRAGIPHRLATRGYHGNGRWMHQCVDVDAQCYVGRAALKFAELLGLAPDRLPGLKPQIFLTNAEYQEAEQTWAAIESAGTRRLIIGFGGGYAAKCWPLECFRQVLEFAAQSGGWCIALVGGVGDSEAGAELANGLDGVTSFAGKLSLRQTFALTAASHKALTNSSMLMHVAAAFDKPAVVVLGAEFESAQSHARLWSCSPATLVLGPERLIGGIASPDMVWDCLQRNRTEHA